MIRLRRFLKCWTRNRIIAFNDHYLDLDYDLSEVFFITTANNLHGIPMPLQDRMEIIQISGYTEEEKLKIAQGYLIPKQLEANGFAEKDISLTDGSILEVVRRYTKEAGVRDLERNISSVCRKIARDRLKKGITTKNTASTPTRWSSISVRQNIDLVWQRKKARLACRLVWPGPNLVEICCRSRLH